MGSSRIHTLRILVSDDEKLAVEHAAADFGSCVSVYVRHRLLDQEKPQLTGKDRQNSVSALCNLCRLTGEISGEALRADIEKEVAELWRLLE